MKLTRALLVVAVVGLFSVISGLPGCGCSSTTTDGDGGNSAFDDLAGTGIWLGGDGPITLIDGGITIQDDGGTFTCYQTLCNGKLLQCGDCIDNDKDGLNDWRDPECLGPCDNTEGPELTAGVGGETGGPCKADCYFDFGNGPGNDNCMWDHRCDPLEVGPAYNPEGIDCAYKQSMVGGKDCPANQSQQCLNFCRPLTPNGCDCFGCCTFPQIPGQFVWIGSMDASNNGTCTFAAITDQTKCRPCTPVADCFNDCGHCELCIGKTTLPPECLATDGGVSPGTDGGSSQRCSPGVQVCGLPGEPDCAVGFYCISGCCIDTAPIL